MSSFTEELSDQHQVTLVPAELNELVRNARNSEEIGRHLLSAWRRDGKVPVSWW